MLTELGDGFVQPYRAGLGGAGPLHNVLTHSMEDVHVAEARFHRAQLSGVCTVTCPTEVVRKDNKRKRLVMTYHKPFSKFKRATESGLRF